MIPVVDPQPFDPPHHSRSTASGKAPAPSLPTCRACVTMEVHPLSFLGPSKHLATLSNSILDSRFDPRRLLLCWADRSRRCKGSVQMQHRRLFPHECLRCLPRRQLVHVRSIPSLRPILFLARLPTIIDLQMEYLEAQLHCRRPSTDVRLNSSAFFAF